MAPGDPAHPLSPLARQPSRAGLVSDFDGTLARIVADPAAARPVPGAVDLLHLLAGALAVVGVVSGRPVEFLLRHLGPVPGRLRLAGLYGLERAEGDGAVRVLADAASWAEAVGEATRAAREGAPPGLGVEAKGLTLALHWRAAPDTAEWARAFAREAAEASGLVHDEGRSSVELRPALAIDKGTVVTEWCGGLAAACFLGDDRADLAAFAALDGLAQDQGMEVVKVAVTSPELPAELEAASDVTVDGPDGAMALMGVLAGQLG